MPEDFIGELSKVSLLDLVAPLVKRKNSGKVLVRGTETGELYIEAGAIVHAKAGNASGDDAALAMIEWNKGRAIFDWESATDERTVHLPTEQVLALWTEREQEWKRIKKVVPSADAVFRLPIDSTDQDRHISGNQWSIMALSNGTRSVAEIAGMLGRDVSEVSKAVCHMFDAGLLEKAKKATPPSTETVHGDFIPTIEAELEKALGPVARSIVDDKIAKFRESGGAFPRDRAQAFVKAIAEEISDEAKRGKFEVGVLEVTLREIESTYNLADLPTSPANPLLSVDEFCQEIKSAGQVRTGSAEVESPESAIKSLLDNAFKPDAAQDNKPHRRRWAASLGYSAVILFVAGLGLIIFTGRQANKPVPMDSGSTAAAVTETKTSTAPLPSVEIDTPPPPAPIPQETTVAPGAKPKLPVLGSRQPKSVKRSPAGNRESPVAWYIGEGQRQYREGNYMKAKEAFLQALASDPNNQSAAEGLRNVRTAQEAEEKLFRNRNL